MRILFGTSHPKHVYIFKNVITNLMEKGHEVKIVAVEKEITEYLLKQFDMPYTVIGKNQPKLYRKLLALQRGEYLTYKIAKEFKPDIFAGRALPRLAHISAVLNKPFIVFEDTEIAEAVHKITLPFADAVVTLDCYKEYLGKKHICFGGYFELAYLHPNYFKPDSSVLGNLGLSKNDKFTVLRFISWSADHEINLRGFKDGSEIEFIKALEQYRQAISILEDEKSKKSWQKKREKLLKEKIDVTAWMTDFIENYPDSFFMKEDCI